MKNYSPALWHRAVSEYTSRKCSTSGCGDVGKYILRRKVGIRSLALCESCHTLLLAELRAEVTK